MWFKRTWVVLMAVVVALPLLGSAAPADASVSQSLYRSNYKKGPTFYYQSRGTITNGRAILYMSIDDHQGQWNRIRYETRAGSGSRYDTCTDGRIPPGVYSVGTVYSTSRNNPKNGEIKGDAWTLSNAPNPCYQVPGSPYRYNEYRTGLFVHTESTKWGGQGSTEPRRWDGNSDYYSLGCIKIERTDLGYLDAVWAYSWDRNNIYFKVLS